MTRDWLPSPKELKSALGDDDLLSEALIALKQRLGTAWPVKPAKKAQHQVKQNWIDGEGRRWDTWARGTRGPKPRDDPSSKAAAKPAINVTWNHKRCLQLALYFVLKVRVQL